MKKLFVSYKIAKQLKEKGFDEPCFGKYVDKGFHSMNGWCQQIYLVPITQFQDERPTKFGGEFNPYEKNSYGKTVAPITIKRTWF